MAYAFRNQTSAGNASGGALSINKPASTANGDLLVVVAYLESDTNTFSSVPSGWSLAGSIANTGAFKLWVYWKVAASEPASWSWTPNVNGWRAFVCAAYSGGTTPAVDVVGTGAQADGVTTLLQTAPSLTTITANDLLIFAYANFNGDNVATMSGAATNMRVSFGSATIADATIVSPGATGTSRPLSGPGTETYAAIHIAFKLGVGGGTTFTLSADGTLTSSGGLTKQDNKVLAGALTSAGTLLKQPGKLMAGALTSAGLLRKQANKLLSGSLTPSGALASIKTALLTINGNLTSSGSLTKQANKLAAGTLTSAGSLLKQANKLISGSLTSSGALASIKTAILSIGGSLTSSGRLTKQPGKVFSGILSSAGQLIKQVNKRAAGSLTSSGALAHIKTVVLSIGGSLSSSGGLRKQVNTSFSGTLAPIGGLLKQARKFFAGALTSLGAFVGVKSGGIIVLAGYDLADTESLPIFFDTVTAPLLADTAVYLAVYDAEPLAVMQTTTSLPLLYDSQVLQVYYDANTHSIVGSSNTIPTIYGAQHG